MEKLKIDFSTGHKEIAERAARNVAEAFWSGAGSYNVGNSSGGDRGPGAGGGLPIDRNPLLQAHRDRQAAK